MFIYPLKFKSNITNYKNSRAASIGFTSNPAVDTFEKTSTPESFNMKVFNPYTNSYCDSDVALDLTKPQRISLVHNSRHSYKDKFLELDYNPQRYDHLFDKINNTKIKTMILISESGRYKTSYHFMSENLDKEYGYVELSKCKNPRVFDTPYYDLLKDYPDFDIVGPRVIVDYLQNWDDKQIGKIGHLADKLTVKFCLENNLPLNIISVADKGSHVAHYLRGKRYLPIDKDTCTYTFFKERYGKDDINEILSELIQKAKQAGEKVNLKDWGTQTMYMPKELCEKYLKELKMFPIL